MKKLLITTLAALYLLYLSGPAGVVLAAGSADLSITKATDLNASNQFSINVNLNITSGDSTGARVTFTYDNTALTYVSGTIGSFYDINSDWGAGTHMGPYRTGNSLSFTATVPLPPAGQAPQYRGTGSGILATFTFTANTPPAAGQTMSTTFTFDRTGAATKCQVASWDTLSQTSIDILNLSPAGVIQLTGYTPTVTHTITSLSRTTGAIAGDYAVTINGTGLDTLTTKTITWGSTTIASTDTAYINSGSWGATTIALKKIPVGPAAGGQVDVNVSGTTGGPLHFTYDAPDTVTHTITSLSRTTGAIAGDYAVTINGTGLDTLTTKTITWGSTTIASTDTAYINSGSWGATTIALKKIPVGPAAGGQVDVNVSGTTGGPLHFTYDAPDITTDTTSPYISYLNPPSGDANADVVVNIVGGNFGDSLTGASVTFGQYTAHISSWTPGQITVTAPKLGQIYASATYDVVVTRSDGKTARSYYTYLAPVSTDGGTGEDETTDTGMPMEVWAGLISGNGLLALLVKRRFF